MNCFDKWAPDTTDAVNKDLKQTYTELNLLIHLFSPNALKNILWVPILQITSGLHQKSFIVNPIHEKESVCADVLKEIGHHQRHLWKALHEEASHFLFLESVS